MMNKILSIVIIPFILFITKKCGFFLTARSSFIFCNVKTLITFFHEKLAHAQDRVAKFATPRSIWPPFWQKKCQKWQIRVFCRFPCQKSVQMLSDSNSETRFGILSSFQDILAPICKDLHILMVWPSIVVSKFQSHRAQCLQWKPLGSIRHL